MRIADKQKVNVKLATHHLFGFTLYISVQKLIPVYRTAAIKISDGSNIEEISSGYVWLCHFEITLNFENHVYCVARFFWEKSNNNNKKYNQLLRLRL